MITTSACGWRPFPLEAPQLERLSLTGKNGMSASPNDSVEKVSLPSFVTQNRKYRIPWCGNLNQYFKREQ
jgi:hypothetical protein